MDRIQETWYHARATSSQEHVRVSEAARATGDAFNEGGTRRARREHFSKEGYALQPLFSMLQWIYVI